VKRATTLNVQMRWLSRVSVKGARSRVSIKGSCVSVKGRRVGVKCYRVSVSPSLRRAALTEGGLRRQHLVGVLLGTVLEQDLEQLGHAAPFVTSSPRSVRGQARASRVFKISNTLVCPKPLGLHA